MTRLLRPICLLLLPLCLLAACAGKDGGTLANSALEAVGLKTAAPPPLAPESQQPPRNVALRLHAARRLNVNARGDALALLVRVYKLRQRAAFEQAPYAAFQSPQAEREAFGADLVEAKEFTLVPGQQLDISEKMAREAAFLGVVALFHTPAREGWRLDFAAPDAEKSGVTVGLHACAMSVGLGAAAIGVQDKPLALVRCQ